MTDRPKAFPSLSRRRFLKGSLGLGLGTILASSLAPGFGCSQKAAQEKEPYSVWRELQIALRASPDHSLGRAQALVSQGDPLAIHQFVRDEIQLVSGEGWRFALGGLSLWGSRAALRCGAGTARDKAEILADLLRQTGRQAEVVESSALARTETEANFFRIFEQPFEPTMTDSQIGQWKERLQTPTDADIKALEVDPGGDALARLVSSLTQALGPQVEKIGRNRFDNRAVGNTPLVKVTESDGSVRYADPIRATGTFGDYPKDAGKERPASEIKGIVPVEVLLSARTSEPKDAPLELAKGVWTAEQIAGRQLKIGFRPTAQPAVVLLSRFDDLLNFVPVLEIQALDGAEGELGQRVVMGDAFTLHGQRMQVSEDGVVSVDGRPILNSQAGPESSAVDSLEVKVDASRFPDIRLRVSPFDSRQRIVEGLAPAAFQITEQKIPVGFNLLANRPAPRVLFLADSSLSMPEDFRGGRASMEALVERVRTFAQEIHPDAQLELTTTGSSLWQELAKASSRSFTLIIYATDGDLDGEPPTPKMLEVMRQGPPALILDVKDRLSQYREQEKSNIFDDLAQATKGEAFSVEDGSMEKAEEAIRRALLERSMVDPYEIQYIAPVRDTGRHTVSVVVGTATGEASYQVPADAALPSRLASLQLSVKVGDFSVTRTLAGYDGLGALEQKHFDAVQGALFGSHLLAFEGPPPSLSVLLDDLLQAKLGLEDLDRAVGREAEDEEIEGLLAKGFPYFPGELATLLGRSAERSAPDFSTAPQGLRTVLYSSYPVMNSDRFVKRVDILPLERCFVHAEDRQRLLEVALYRSANLAMAEATLFPQSTVSMLQGKSLETIGKKPFAKSELSEEKKARWSHLTSEVHSWYRHPSATCLTAAQGEVFALWAVDNLTGEALGVLSDGSGGGSAELQMQKQLASLDQVVSGLNLLAAAAGSAGAVSSMGGFSLGIVAAYGQRLARMYAAVSVAIILMDSSGIQPALRLAVAGMACEVAKAITFAAFDSAGKMAARAASDFANTENVIGLLGGSTPFSCAI